MKRLMFGTLLFFAGSLTATAQVPASGLMSVSEALNARDNSLVAINATLVKPLGREKYEFQDASGSITVEIDEDISRHIVLKNGQSVTLYGEIEREYKGIELEADHIEIH